MSFRQGLVVFMVLPLKNCSRKHRLGNLRKFFRGRSKLNKDNYKKSF